METCELSFLYFSTHSTYLCIEAPALMFGERSCGCGIRMGRGGGGDQRGVVPAISPGISKLSVALGS
jgi:hypothetical protein